MNKEPPKYCLNCAAPLKIKTINQQEYLACLNHPCDFVLWNNPIPVIGGIVETEKGVILSHNKLWAEDIYSIITGFLEYQETPEEAILREIKEELGLIGFSPKLVGIYPFKERNQIILVYHVKAAGEITLNDELDAIKIFTKEALKAWPFGQEKLHGWPLGCGWAIRDWLKFDKLYGLEHASK